MNGQSACLNVTAQNFTNIIGMQFTINYNPAMLQFVSVGNFNLEGLVASNFGVPGAGGTSPGTITLSWTDPDLGGETLANGATVFQLCFTALTGTGSTQVTFGNTPTAIEIINSQDETVPFNSVPGTVTFGAAPPGSSISLAISSANNVIQGQQVCLNVTATDFTNVNSLQFSINYNSSMLQFASVGGFNLPGLTVSNFNTATPGVITMTWTNANGQTVANGGALFQLCFTATGSAGSTMVTFGNTPTMIAATNAGGQTLTVNTSPGTVSFGMLTGFHLIIGSANNVMNGQQVCLNVTTANFNNIIGMQFTINYNPAMLQFVSVGAFNLQGLTVSNFGTPGPGGTNPGTITFSWTDPDLGGETLGNGTPIFQLCFTALVGSGSTQLTFGNTPTAIEIINAQSQTVPFNSIPGTVVFGTTVPIDPPVITSPANITNVACFGASTGAINITVQGGSGNYSYIWSHQGATTQDLSGIPAGTYSVAVTDTGSGLTTSGSFTVTQPAMALSVIALPTHVSCAGGTNGEINLIVTGGTGAYSYNWSGSLPDGSPSQTGLAAGTYSVTVSDANGCMTSQTVTINQPTGAALNVTSQVQPVVCAGASTGSITLNITGGTPQYSINWCCGLPANQTTVSNLAAGAYTVTVTDNNGCTANRTINVGSNPPLMLTSITPVNINNGNDGAINITVIGGMPGYTFNWSGPPGFGGSSQPNLTGLNIPGQYCITVTDNSNCTATGCVQLLERLRFTNIQITRTCSGASTGAIDISVQGGTPPYTYAWTPGGSTNQDLTNIPGGTYNVVVTDNAGEQLTGSFVVDNHPAIVATGTVVNASGNITNTNGSVTLNLSGGTPGFTVTWAPGGATGPVLNNVPTGQYCATIVDMANCSIEQCFTVGFNPGPLTVVDTQTTNVTCPGDNDGSLTLTLDGGLPPFTVVFSDGNTQTVSGITVSRSNLPAGMLSYTITDAAGTVITGSVNITVSTVVSTTDVIVVHDTEEPGCIGSVTLVLTGGVTPYMVQWNTPNTGGPQINNLCAGSFIPTVTDANGCVYVLPAIVVNTFGLSANTTATDCPEDETGAIDLVVSGGSTPYTYEWRNAAGMVVSNDEDLGDVPPGTYTVRVTEASGNELVRNYTIGSVSSLALDVDVLSNFNGFDVSCHNASNGQMEATAFNGQGNYTYEWRLNGNVVGGANATLSNAAPGEYQVRVTDELGCTSTETLTLTAPQAVTVVANAIAPSCVGGNDGQLLAAASGGVFSLPYTYEWSNGGFGPRITFLRSGSYTVSVSDVNNCSTTATFTVAEPAPIEVTVNATPATEGCNGSILAVVSGGTAPYTFNWSTGQTTTDPFLTGLCPGDYFVMVTDSRGCRPNPNLASGNVRDRRTPCFDMRVVITPDGDGLNEEFLISCIEEFRENRLEIYNRWGQLVFEMDGYDNTWRGTTRNGSELPDGPYYFVFEYTDIDGVRQQLKGSITVLRQ
ncbi:MAG: gliding motility-associated C-terminal domain-containing protein [Saprospiraceae bacterium]|nr:gliding motility-associated C-terminal domain-containing protein [Saprospiraceae bacterium]